MITRRQLLTLTGATALVGGLAGLKGAIAHDSEVQAASRTRPGRRRGSYTPLVTPNGSTLGWKMKNGIKEFHLIAEPVEREFAPGMKVKCWGYNGQTPGPTIEAVQGDRVRILVTNKLPEHTTVHMHGVFLPSGMDGVGGLTQPQIKPGETYVYEFRELGGRKAEGV